MTAEHVLGPAPEDSFTIVVLPDTQAFADRWPKDFLRITGWIVEHIERQRIVFCSHVGDLVEHCDNAREWDAAREAMNILHGHLPYGIAFGNHDFVSRDKKWARSFFPASRYSDKQTMNQTSTGFHGNTVHELECDYMFASRDVPAKGTQERVKALSRDGWLRLLRFLPCRNRIEVRTFSPLTGEICLGTAAWPDPNLHRFNLELEW